VERIVAELAKVGFQRRPQGLRAEAVRCDRALRELERTFPKPPIHFGVVVAFAHGIMPL